MSAPGMALLIVAGVAGGWLLSAAVRVALTAHDGMRYLFGE